MQITMLAVGSRGDVQPFLALGRGLQAAGHTVQLATHRIFEDWIRAEGIGYAPMEGDPQRIVQGEQGRAWMESGRNPLKFAQGFRLLAEELISRGVHDALEAARSADALVVTGPSYYIGHSIAEKLRIPFMQAYVQPLHPTREFPSPLFPAAVKGSAPLNLLTYYIGGQMFWQGLRSAVNKARRDLLDLPPTPFLGPFAELMREKYPVVYGFSRHVIPKPKAWEDWLHVTGFWFLDHDDGWTPPADLQAFLDAGAPPVYIGFGSMADRNPERMTAIALGALERSGQRGVLLTGWGGISQYDLPDTVIKVESAPHSWLFPRMAAVVHHGGAGTTAAGLRAGKPSIIIPFFGDQPFWGQRVSMLGVGTSLSRKSLSAETLGDAISRAVTDNAMRSAADRLGEAIRAENGVARAVEVIDGYLRAKVES